MDEKNISLNVKRIAKEKKMLLGSIEEAVGVSPGYLSRTRRQKGISVKTLIKLSSVLEVPVEDLLNNPPEFTNGKKFEEVFGFTPNGYGITNRGYENESHNGVFIRWDDKYVEPILDGEVKL